MNENYFKIIYKINEYKNINFWLYKISKNNLTLFTA